MQKNRMKTLLAELFLSLNTQGQVLNFKEQLLQKYSQEVHQEFAALLVDNDATLQTIEFAAIQQKLADIWRLIGGTLLSYTAHPDTAATHFLLQVAYAALQEKTPGSKPQLMEVVKLLIPSLRLDDIDSVLTPKDCGCELPEAPISCLEFSPDQPDPLATLVHFFKTHLIADNQEYIIPIWALNKFALDSQRETLDNVYYPLQLNPDSPAPTELTPAECVRLEQHNSYTLYISEIYNRLRGYQQNKSSLLGQLNLLTKSLEMNSKNGIGTEEQAGSLAERSIRQFFDYYATLDAEELARVLTPPLKHQIMKLRHCIAEYHPNEPKIQNIETCMGTRRRELRDAMQDQDASLALIGSSDNNLSQLIATNQAELTEEFKQLNEAIQHNKLVGYEHLPVTMALVEYYKIDLAVTDFESLTQLFDGLSAEEIANLVTKRYAENWSWAINHLDNLVLMFIQLPTEKIEVLCQHLAQNLKNQYLVRAINYLSLLLFLPPEKQLIVAKYFININKLVKNTGPTSGLLFLTCQHAELFPLIWGLLPREKYVQVVKNKNINGDTLLHCAAATPEILKFILNSLPDNKRLAAVKNLDINRNTALHLDGITVNDLKSILELLPANDRLKAMQIRNDLDKSFLYKLTDNMDELKMLLELLPDTDCLAALKIFDKEVKHVDKVFRYLINDFEHFKIILNLLPAEHYLDVMQFKNKKGKTVLHEAARDIEKLSTLVRFLPDHKRLEALLTADKKGKTVFDYLAIDTEHSKTILGLLSADERKTLTKDDNDSAPNAKKTKLNYSSASLSSSLFFGAGTVIQDGSKHRLEETTVPIAKRLRSHH